jgi:hypothetical protein
MNEVIEINPVEVPRTIVGTRELGFYLSATWPNELGNVPDDLIGRLVKVNDGRYKIVSRRGEWFVLGHDKWRLS